MYAYVLRQGLVQVDAKTGAIHPYNKPIDAFLQIDAGSPKSIKDYIDTYGFFFTLPPNGKYSFIHHIDVAYFIRHCQSLFSLVSALYATKNNYEDIFQRVTDLLFAPPHTMLLDDTTQIRQTYVHPFTRLWCKNDLQLATNRDYDNLSDITTYATDEFISAYPLRNIQPHSDDSCSFADKHDNIEYVNPFYEDDIAFDGNITIRPLLAVPDTFTKFTEIYDECDVEESMMTDYSNPQPSPSIQFLKRISSLYFTAFPINDSFSREVVDFFYHLSQINLSIELTPDNTIKTSTPLRGQEQKNECIRERMHFFCVMSMTSKRIRKSA